MTLRLQLIAILVSLILIGIIVELIRRKQLKVEYSVFWFLVAILSLIFSLWQGVLKKLAEFLGALSPLGVLVILGFGSITLILLYLSIIISKISNEKKDIFKELSIMKWKLERLNKEKNKYGVKE